MLGTIATASLGRTFDRRLLLAGVAAWLLLLAAPASSWAVNVYVDDDSGSDANGCYLAADPCETIDHALNGLASPLDPGGVVVVDGGSYAEQVQIPYGIGLKGEEFSGDVEPATVIDGGGGTAIAPSPLGVLTISGLTIVNSTIGIQLDGAATVTANRIVVAPDPNAPGAAPTPAGISGSGAAADSSVIEANRLIGDGATRQLGIELDATGPEISGNRLEGLNAPIQLSGAGADSLVKGNQITGTHFVSSFPGRGVSAFNGAGPAIVANRIATPPHPALEQVDGILVSQAGAAATSARVDRNLISGNETGVSVADTEGPVALDGNLIAENPGLGLSTQDGGDDGGGDLSVTNTTFAGNGIADIALLTTELSLDSSIVEKPIDDSLPSPGSGACTIAFSRGPTTTGNDCEAFTSAATPGYANGPLGDYSLSAGSTLIDAGNPAAPAVGALDIDGRPRAIDADVACPIVPIRDIGAYELAAIQPDCEPPETTITTGPKPKLRLKGKRRAVKFRFASSEDGSSFECSLDGGPFTACASPAAYSLRPGKHRFRVAARDAVGNLDPTPALRRLALKPKRKK